MHPIEIAEHGLMDNRIVFSEDTVVLAAVGFELGQRFVKRKKILKYIKKKLKKKIRRQLKKIRCLLSPEVLYPSI